MAAGRAGASRAAAAARLRSGDRPRWQTIVHAADARAAAEVDLHFADGRVAAQIGDGTAPVPFRPAKRVEPKGRDPYLPGQADLFGNED